MPDDLLDVAVLRAYHHKMRSSLEAAIPLILEHDQAKAALVQLFRDRAERYPLAFVHRGGSVAHAAR
jgi:hypothetical protein